MEKGNKKIINGWIFYDWANSAYPLVITTAIFPIFYENVTQHTLPNGTTHDLVTLFGRSFKNTELYAYTVALSFLMVAFISPLLSGVADYTGRKKFFLKTFCYLGSLACASLFWFDANNLLMGMLSILLASIGYWGSIVFYNAYLPEIAAPEHHDRVSAKGYAMGYLGSAILLLACLFLLKNYTIFGYKETDTILGFSAPGFFVRISFLATAIWWLGFAQITFIRLPKHDFIRAESGEVLLKGFRELKHVWTDLKEQKQLKRYLLAFFVYSMGVQTVMLMAVMFAKKEIKGMDDAGLITSVLLIQFIGIAGSFFFSFLSRKLGNFNALTVAILIWIALCIGTFLFVYNAQGFYIVAAGVGMVMGGIQSLSRSTYSKLLPETLDHASYFSFYDVSEKIGIVIGMFSFGYIEGITGNMRNSILALITFFIIGLVLLFWTPRSNSVAIQPEQTA